MKELLNQVDLCFVIDTTGSMGGFLQSARDALVETLTALTEKQNLDLRVALVEYRDHPPQEHSFVARKYPMTSDLRQIERAIADLKAEGGGDRPQLSNRQSPFEFAANRLSSDTYARGTSVLAAGGRGIRPERRANPDFVFR